MNDTRQARSRLAGSNLDALQAGVAVPGYTRESVGIGIVHIGPGAFHRAHQAAYVDALLHRDGRWGISEVALKTSSVRDALAPQDGLYTLAELGETRRLRIIGAIRELLVASESPEHVFSRLVSPQVRFVTLTVTEKGYCLDPSGTLDGTHPDIAHDLRNPQQPHSVVGWLVEALRRRRALQSPPFAIVSCDNLSNNGQALGRALIDFAAYGGGDLAQWIAAEVECPRTMVDSITPATDDALRDFVADGIGAYDAWPVQREPFTQWVIEDLPSVRAADWGSVGVTLARDVSQHERAKIRLLNGAHSTLAYVGLLCGHETVGDAMRDAQLAGFVERLMREDIAPTLSGSSELRLDEYIGAILQRFRNPGIRHLLAQIAWDGSKKLPVRILDTVRDAAECGQRVDRLAVCVAAWMRFIARQARAGVPIVDPEAQALARIGQACTGRADEDMKRFAALPAVFPSDLLQCAPYAGALARAYDRLSEPRAVLSLGS